MQSWLNWVTTKRRRKGENKEKHPGLSATVNPRLARDRYSTERDSGSRWMWQSRWQTWRKVLEQIRVTGNWNTAVESIPHSLSLLLNLVIFSDSLYLARVLQIQTLKSVSSPVSEFQLYFSCSKCGWNSRVVALFFRFLNIWNIAENRNSCFPMLLKGFFKGYRNFFLYAEKSVSGI